MSFTLPETASGSTYSVIAVNTVGRTSSPTVIRYQP
jgi:hypothetical protein